MSLPNVRLTRVDDEFTPPAKALSTDTIPTSPGSAGTHATCGGNMTLQVVSVTHRAMVCARCCLRVPLVNSVITYGQLFTEPWAFVA